MPIYNHDDFIPLTTEMNLWRYLDLYKFQSLLETQSLFFCRADKFSDPFEGSIPKKEADYRLTAQKKSADLFQRTFDQEQALKNIVSIKDLHQKFKRGVVINCWQINENESDAMWRLYLKDNEGVAIQTTTSKMVATIQKTSEEIGLSKVRYLNYEKDIWYDPGKYPGTSYNFIVPLIHKRIEFIHESEFRLFIIIQEAIDDDIYWDNQKNEKGMLVKVDIQSLIDKIYLPPTIDQASIDKITSLAENLGYNFQFVRSKLSFDPVY